MKTLSQLSSGIIAQVFPSGQPEGLGSGHGLLFQEGVSKIYSFLRDEDLQLEPHVNVIRFCQTQYKCGMTVFENPATNGIIRRIFVVCNDQECDPVFYRQVKWPMPEWHGKRSMLFSGTTTAGGAALRLGFSEASAANDAKCGRSRSGIWAIYRGNIYIAPWIQSTEKIVVEWDGLKKEWSADDPLPEDQEFRNTLKMFFQYAHERDYGSPERAMQFHNPQAMRDPERAGAFDLQLAEYLNWVRDRTKVRRFEDHGGADPYCLLDGQYDQCVPKDVIPLVLAHIGNYGVQAFGEADVAELVAGFEPAAVLACGTTPSPDYDTSVGQFYHSLIKGYAGAFGGGAEKNAFWPAPSDADWELGTNLDAFKAFFELPNNERYYDVCLGAVHLFALSNNVNEPDGLADTSVQATWLKAKLALSTAPWKVVLAEDVEFTVLFVSAFELGISVNSSDEASIQHVLTNGQELRLSVKVGDKINFFFDGIDTGTFYTVVNPRGVLTVVDTTSNWSFAATASVFDWPLEDWGANMLLLPSLGSYVRSAVGLLAVIKNGLGGNNSTSYGAGKITASACSLKYEMMLTSGVLLDSVELTKPVSEECPAA